MTKCNLKSAEFERQGRREVVVDFEGGNLSSDGGLLLLRKVDRRLNLIQRMADLIPDPRGPAYMKHTQAEMLTSRIFGIAAGYEDGNDHQHLRHDSAFQLAAGRAPTQDPEDEDHSPLASPSTLSRFENRIDDSTLLKLSELMVDIFLESYDCAPEEIILDYDATDDATHGNQEQRYFNGFYGSYCFLPLYVFCGNQILAAYLRPSSKGAAHNSTALTKLLVTKIRSRWPDTQIIIRGDGGFSLAKLMRWCDKNDVQYVFGLPKNNALLREIEDETAQAKMDFEATGEKQTRFTWFRYKTTKSWRCHRWVLGKVEHGEQGANPRFVVTNIPSSEGIVDTIYHRPRNNGKQKREIKQEGVVVCPVINAEAFYREMYCPRGEMENRIKEQKLFLYSDRTSCTKFQANQFRLLLSSFAYVLLDGLRRLGLASTSAPRMRVDSIRLKLIKIAARVRVSCRRIRFHLCSRCPAKDLFNQVILNLCRSG